MVTFHGTKPQCLYSIVANQDLREVFDQTEGRSTIYQHKTSVTLKDVQKDKDWLDKLKSKEFSGTSHKAEHYCHHVDMFGDGTFWTARLELAANRSSEAHNKKKCCATKKDQWWQTADTCKIRAIWIQRISAADMHAGSGHIA